MTEKKCPVPESEDKFEEAHYFINEMLTNYHNPPEFRWSLNAFLQALRNVTFLLQKELNHRKGFKEWWELQQKIMLEDEILRKFKAGRNIVVKQGALHFKSKADVGLFRNRKLKLTVMVDAPVELYSVALLERAKKTFIGQLLDEEHSEVGMEIGVKRIWNVDELGDGEVIGQCNIAWSRIGTILSNAHTFCGVKSNIPPENGHDIELVNLLTETDVDPALANKWGWNDF